jgi:hypothetical protein
MIGRGGAVAIPFAAGDEALPSWSEQFARVVVHRGPLWPALNCQGQVPSVVGWLQDADSAEAEWREYVALAPA